eukprot:SAG22_NODE_3734_length_1554_cov_1.437113_2_plen_90_part_00
MRAIAADGLRWFDAELATRAPAAAPAGAAGGPGGWLAAVDGGPGLADILLFSFVEWGDNDRIGYPVDRAELPGLARWYDAMLAWPSAAV